MFDVRCTILTLQNIVSNSYRMTNIVHQTSYIVHFIMTNEQLTAYLQDESYLYSLNYEELKSLVVQYPYATNLRILLLKKAYIEQNKDYDRHLNMAAAYTTDRRFLYRAIKRMKTLQIIPENVILGEDYLELSALSDLDRVVKEKHTVEMPMTAETAKALSAGFILDFETPTHTEEDEEAMFDVVLNSKKDVDLENLSEEDLDILVKNLVHEFQVQPKDMKLHALDTIEAKTEKFEADIKKADNHPILHLEDLVEAKTKGGEDDIIDDAISTMNGLNNGHKVDDIVSLLQPEVETTTIPLPEKNALIEEILDSPVPVIKPDELQPDGDKKTTFAEPIEVKEDEDTIDYENSVALSIEDIIKAEQVSQEIEEKPTEFAALDNSVAVNEPITAVIENEEIAETVSQIVEKQSFITFTHSQQLFEKGEDDDMKKQDIELEIINQTKATIVGNEVVADTTPAPKVSFAEWLQQFKMVSIADKIPMHEAKIETPTVQTTTTKPTVKTTTTTIVRRTTLSPQGQTITEMPNEANRILQKETLSDLFEKKEELPENLFNLPTDGDMLDEADYKGKIEAIFDDFLTQQPNDNVEKDTLQHIDNDALVVEHKTLSEPVNTEGVIKTNSLLDMEDDDDDEEDDELPQETKTKKLHEWAKQSIVEDDEFVSETLADMFAKQGNYKKAIDIYERLSLQMPEKSDFFAAKIQKLRIKIISIF